MNHNTVQFGENTVTKTSTAKLMSVEVEKTVRAAKIGENCGLFYVPKVLEYDKGKGVAVFERIHQIRPIGNVIKSTKHCKSIVEQIGCSLAVIHRELTLPENMTIELPTEFRLAGTEVFFHGDFNGINVCVVPYKPSIVILDWQMTNLHGGEATFGSRYFDLLWFINYLLWNPTIKYLFQDPINKVVKPFLQSYFNGTACSDDAEMLIEYSYNFFEAKSPAKKQYPSRRKRYMFQYSNGLTRRFIKSLHSFNPDNIL